MKNGIYEAIFTTSLGTLGVAAVLIKNNSFVGADGMQFYRGELQQSNEVVRVLMEVTRHNFAIESAFGSESMFTLTWDGKALDDSSFKLECQPPGLAITIYVAGRLISEID